MSGHACARQQPVFMYLCREKSLARVEGLKAAAAAGASHCLLCTGEPGAGCIDAQRLHATAAEAAALSAAAASSAALRSFRSLRSSFLTCAAHGQDRHAEHSGMPCLCRGWCVFRAPQGACAAPWQDGAALLQALRKPHLGDPGGVELLRLLGAALLRLQRQLRQEFLRLLGSHAAWPYRHRWERQGAGRSGVTRAGGRA